MANPRPAPERIALSDKERALVRRLKERTAYIGIADFRGPRGRKYIPIRTEASVTIEQAEQALERITHAQYAHGAFPTKSELYAVDQLGRVIA
jgi:hypothetical protein